MKRWQEEYKRKLIQPADLQKVSAACRERGKTIATINGSFDLLHSGHLQSVYEASQLADVVIVALNSDSSIQQYKDPSRPIIPLEYRLQMMAALEWVDYVTWFEETDPREILKKIKPDIHVNGIQWKGKSPEEDYIRSYGGDLHYVPLYDGLSTTQIVNNIINRYDRLKAGR